MKRMICYILMIVLLVGVMPIGASASEIKTIYFEDGCYAIIELSTNETRASGSKSGSKTYNYYDSSDVKLWKAVLTGSFTYTGSSASCTAADLDITIYNSAWSTQYGYASKDWNKAVGSGMMLKKTLGVTVLRESVSLTLTCDSNGNLS